MKHTLIKNIFYTFLIGVVCFLSMTIIFFNTQPDLLRIQSSSTILNDSNSKIYDLDGKLYCHLSSERRQPVSLSQMPPLLRQAFISAEDKDFYQHIGISISSIVRAVFYNTHNATWQKRPLGASTITQQIIKNLYIGNEKSFYRKIKEIFLAMHLEYYFSKDQLLEIYLNQIYLGRRSYGVSAAAQTYFHKKLHELTLSECAYIASLPKAPTSYQSQKDMPKALQRRNWVMMRMAEDGYISFKQANDASLSPLELYSFENPKQNTYAALEIKRISKKVLAPQHVETKGYIIYATIKPELQQMVEDILQKHIQSIQEALSSKGKLISQVDRTQNNISGALMIMDAYTGNILALSGGVDPLLSNFNNATQALRQIGSTFKPIVYAAALESGYEKDTLVDDAPISIYQGRKIPAYKPRNFSKNSLGLIPLHIGLAKSQNQMTVRLAQNIGLQSIITMAQRLGLPLRHSNNFSLVLGATEMTLQDICGAFASFVNGGRRVKPHIINAIYNQDKHLLLYHPFSSIHSQGIVADQRPKVFDAKIANDMMDMLHGVVEYGTASKLKPLQQLYNIEIGGKTGTTNDCKDAWFIGYLRFPSNQRWIIGTFIGYEKPKSLGSKASGAKIAIPIIEDLIHEIGKTLP